MIYPESLKNNGKIGFIAPSFGCALEHYRTCFDSALSKFKELGYEAVLGPNVYESSGIGKSNTAEACGAEINDFFLNNHSDIIISCGGGETMCEDLEFVDFEGIKKAEPKWFLGYSDNSNLAFTLPTICDIAAVYGPCASSFGMELWHESIHDALGILTGDVRSVSNYDKWEIQDPEEDNPLAPYNVTEKFEMKSFIGEKESAEPTAFAGRLIGGCLDCVVTLCGTKFDKVHEFNERYKNDGIIWFLECCDLNPMAMRRALWQLDQAGWFKYAKGFLIGRPMHYDEEIMGMNRFNAVTGVLGKYNVPILMDLDIGHLPPMMPIIEGAIGEVHSEDNKIRISYRCE